MEMLLFSIIIALVIVIVFGLTKYRDSQAKVAELEADVRERNKRYTDKQTQKRLDREAQIRQEIWELSNLSERENVKKEIRHLMSCGKMFYTYDVKHELTTQLVCLNSLVNFKSLMN